MIKRNRNSKRSGSRSSRQGGAKPTTADTEALIQFDWRKHWQWKVTPHLQDPLVQFALDWGMRMCISDWRSGNPPYLEGSTEPESPRRHREGSMRWYQPLGRSHHIAFFSMVIGLLNFPELNWRFVTGNLSTVPVGSDEKGHPRVVMDFLGFDERTAEQSIDLARREKHDPSSGWDWAFEVFETDVVNTVCAALANKKVRPPLDLTTILPERIRDRLDAYREE